MSKLQVFLVFKHNPWHSAQTFLLKSLTGLYQHMGFLQATNIWVGADLVDIRSGSALECCSCVHTAPAGCGRTGSPRESQSCSHWNKCCTTQSDHNHHFGLLKSCAGGKSKFKQPKPYLFKKATSRNREGNVKLLVIRKKSAKKVP
jgi:hypothetical protein